MEPMVGDQWVRHLSDIIKVISYQSGCHISVEQSDAFSGKSSLTVSLKCTSSMRLVVARTDTGGDGFKGQGKW